MSGSSWHLRSDDLLSELLGGTNRLALLWEAEALARPAGGLDHAMIGVERAGDDWLVVQRDVTHWLVDTDRGIDAEQHGRLADGMARLHAHLRDLDRTVDVDQLARVGDYIGLLHTLRLAGYPDGLDELIVGVRMGGKALTRPSPTTLPRRSRRSPSTPAGCGGATKHQATTFVHGDLFHANVAFAPDRLVMLDWSQLLELGNTDLRPHAVPGVQRAAGGRRQRSPPRRIRPGGREGQNPIDPDGRRPGAAGRAGGDGLEQGALVAIHGETAEERDGERAALGWWIAGGAAIPRPVGTGVTGPGDFLRRSSERLGPLTVGFFVLVTLASGGDGPGSCSGQDRPSATTRGASPRYRRPA